MKPKLTFGIEFEPTAKETRRHPGMFGEYPIPGMGTVDLCLLARPQFIPESKHYTAVAVPQYLGIVFECLALDELHAIKQIRKWLDDHNLCTAGIAGLHMSSEHSPIGWLNAIANIPLCCETPGIAAKDEESESSRIMLARKMVAEMQADELAALAETPEQVYDRVMGSTPSSSVSYMAGCAIQAVRKAFGPVIANEIAYKMRCAQHAIPEDNADLLAQAERMYGGNI